MTSITGLEVKFDDASGRGMRQGLVIDQRVSPWSGLTTYTVRVNMSGDYLVPASRIREVLR